MKAITSIKELKAATDAELITYIDELDFWDHDAIEELCWRARLLDEYRAADNDTFEDVLEKAIEILSE